jgi:hypothetical protein
VLKVERGKRRGIEGDGGSRPAWITWTRRPLDCRCRCDLLVLVVVAGRRRRLLGLRLLQRVDAEELVQLPVRILLDLSCSHYHTAARR